MIASSEKGKRVDRKLFERSIWSQNLECREMLIKFLISISFSPFSPPRRLWERRNSRRRRLVESLQRNSWPQPWPAALTARLWGGSSWLSRWRGRCSSPATSWWGRSTRSSPGRSCSACAGTPMPERLSLGGRRLPVIWSRPLAGTANNCDLGDRFSMKYPSL